MTQKKVHLDEEDDQPTLEFAVQRKLAVQAVAKACFLCQKVQERLVSEETIEKKDNSPVTIADYASQALIIAELSKAFPEYPFIAEEDTKDLRENNNLRARVLEQVKTVFPYMDEETLLATIDKGETAEISENTKYWWTLDPIDGTMGFLRRGQYAVALALMEGDEPVIGVLGCPSLPQRPLTHDSTEQTVGEDNVGCILVAVRNQGAWIRGLDSKEEKKISVALVDNPAEAVFTESFVSSHSSHDAGADVAKHLGLVSAPIRIDSQCKYAIVARGDAAAYLRFSSGSYQEKIWDHAPGVLLVKEAGGTVCDLNGQPLDFSFGRTLCKNKGIVATNGKLHDAILGAIKAVDPLGASSKDAKKE